MCMYMGKNSLAKLTRFSKSTPECCHDHKIDIMRNVHVIIAQHYGSLNFVLFPPAQRETESLGMVLQFSISLLILIFNALRALQDLEVKAFVQGNDVFVSLLTGNGTSLCYFILPHTLHKVKNLL